MKERVIKRYANRKMYDVENSKYVSLADLAELIRKGESIRVTNKSGDKDFTAQVLRQIILEQSKDSDKATVTTLHDWVRMGGSFVDQQWDDLKSGMEEWLKSKKSRFFKGLNRDEFENLKNKVKRLEEKIDQL